MDEDAVGDAVQGINAHGVYGAVVWEAVGVVGDVVELGQAVVRTDRGVADGNLRVTAREDIELLDRAFLVWEGRGSIC